jgi:hypothetical protein
MGLFSEVPRYNSVSGFKEQSKIDEMPLFSVKGAQFSDKHCAMCSEITSHTDASQEAK